MVLGTLATENPSHFTRDQDAYEKHGATKATFCRWKQKLTQQSRSVAVDEHSQSLGDGDEDEAHDELSVAFQRRDARLERHEWRWLGSQTWPRLR